MKFQPHKKNLYNIVNPYYWVVLKLIRGHEVLN